MGSPIDRYWPNELYSANSYTTRTPTISRNNTAEIFLKSKLASVSLSFENQCYK